MLESEDDKCLDHLFIIKPLYKECFYKKEVSVEFCDITNKNSSTKDVKISKVNKPNTCKKNFIPILNKDKSYASPCFILKNQKNFYRYGFTKLKQDHQKQMKKLENSLTYIDRAQPNLINKYCHICKDNYEQYFRHIQCSQHKEKIAQSQFNQYIMELHREFYNSIPFKQIDQQENITNSNAQKDNLPRIQQNKLIEFDNLENYEDPSIFNKPSKKFKKDLCQLNRQSINLESNFKRLLPISPYFMYIFNCTSQQKNNSNNQKNKVSSPFEYHKNLFSPQQNHQK